MGGDCRPQDPGVKDREDRDDKQFNKKDGLAAPTLGSPSAAAEAALLTALRAGARRPQGTPQETHQSSGLQASLCSLFK